MLTAVLTANTAGPVLAAPADESAQSSPGAEAAESAQSSSGAEADEFVQSSSGTEAGESVESSSAEQQYDYEAAIAKLEDLENQLDKAREDKEAVLEKVRSLDTKKDRLLDALNETDQKKVVTMAAVTSGSETLKDTQSQMDSVTAAYEQALTDKDKTLDDLHEGAVTVAKIHAYRDAVRNTVKLKKQQTILQSDLDTLTDEQQSLKDSLHNLEEGGDTASSEQTEEGGDAASSEQTEDKTADRTEDKTGDKTAETEAAAPASEAVLKDSSDQYLDLTKSQNALIAEAVKAESRVVSLQSKTKAKADEIQTALDKEQSSFDEEQQAFDDEEQAYQEQLQAAQNAVSGYSTSSSSDEENPSSSGTSSKTNTDTDGSTGSNPNNNTNNNSSSTNTGTDTNTSTNNTKTGNSTDASGDENVITRDNNGNVRIVTVHPDGTTSVADAPADTSGIGETTTDGSISSGNTGDTGGTASGTAVSGVSGQQIVDYAVQFVGNPYVWGGTSLTNGCDCSGFIQSVFAHFGIKLSRTTYTQQYEGREVSYADIQPGDVIYYDGHTAIYMGNNQIVHAANSREGIKISDNPAYRTIVTIRRFY